MSALRTDVAALVERQRQQPTGRVAALLAAIQRQGGEWTTKRVLALYRRLRLEPADMQYAHLRSVARGDLRDLCAWGHLVKHDAPNRLHYTLNPRKDTSS